MIRASLNCRVEFHVTYSKLRSLRVPSSFGMLPENALMPIDLKPTQKLNSITYQLPTQNYYFLKKKKKILTYNCWSLDRFPINAGKGPVKKFWSSFLWTFGYKYENRSQLWQIIDRRRYIEKKKKKKDVHVYEVF